jgi:transposase
MATKSRAEELTDDQWALIAPLLPELPRRADGRGRPWRDNRAVMNGVLWVLRTGAPWADLPARFPPYQTCHRRFQAWVKAGALRQVLETLAADLHKRGGLDLTECFIDGTFVVAKKGATAWEKPSAAKVRSSWQWQTALALLSPSTLQVLRRMKSPLWNQLSSPALSPPRPNA